MKKITITSSMMLAFFAVNAQDNFDPFKDRQFIFDTSNICAVVLVLYLTSSFILKLIKQNLDYRIKSKLIEKEPAENIVTQLMQNNKKDNGNSILQWVFALAGIGIGFTIIYFSRPIGVHTLAIMAFSIATVLLSYYLFISRKNK